MLVGTQLLVHHVSGLPLNIKQSHILWDYLYLILKVILAHMINRNKAPMRVTNKWFLYDMLKYVIFMLEKAS